MSNQRNVAQQRLRRFEEFEKRLMMSADPVASILPPLDLSLPRVTQQVEVAEITQDFQSQDNSQFQAQVLDNANVQPLAQSSPTTDAANVASSYGFDGSGQTVAVIDSGIAWDHYALGGSFGEGSKVVGGWDFAENDANPYDDGPSGFHGSHVAGIIGSEDATYRGVSSGVDLVGLRVFDDNGGGNLEWVEQALQWVHDHKDDFENPITTVNLSLGTTWNADNTPDWATLEDEFAQLEADGLFISVAAGNSFEDYNTTGLSYPASSPFVVPVGSHGSDNLLSDFSQRNDRILAAPGESIRSTVPDFLFGGTQEGAFLGSSGTSMAAPYVAGASAVLREAYASIGMTNVNQDTLYQQFRDTANQIYDSVTGGHYYQVNLDAAISAVINGQANLPSFTQTDAGTITGSETVSGSVSTVGDANQFRFVAGKSGNVSLNLRQDNGLETSLKVNGSDLVAGDGQTAFEVVEGQSYTFSVTGMSGAGGYQVDVSLAPTIVAPTIGTVTDGRLTVKGTDGDDSIRVDTSDSQTVTVTVNGVSEKFAMSNINHIVVLGGGGNDSLQTQLGDTDDSVVTTVDGLYVSNQQYRLGSRGFSDVEVINGGGESLLTLVDTDGNDSFVIDGQKMSAEMSHGNSRSVGLGFSTIYLESTAGNDSVTIVGSEGEDRFVSKEDRNMLFNEDISVIARGFSDANFVGNGGNDVANLYGTSDADQYHLGARVGRVVSEASTLNVTDIGRMNAFPLSSNDTLQMTDSAGDDFFRFTDHVSMMYGDNFSNFAWNMVTTTVTASSGYDVAQLDDTAGDDVLLADGDRITLTTSDQAATTVGFDRVNALARNGGDDTAYVIGTDGDDSLYADQGSLSAELSTGQLTRVVGYENTHFDGKLGSDHANLVGSEDAEKLTGSYSHVTFETTLQMLQLVNTEHTDFDGNGGVDEVVFAEFESLDLLSSIGDKATAYLRDRTVSAEDFAMLEANTVDEAIADYDLEAIDYLYSLRGQWKAR